MLLSSNTHAVLNKIITLTNERDLVSLENLLAESLYELISPNNINVANTVKIFHVKNIQKQQFTTKESLRNAEGEKLSVKLRQTLTNCFTSGENCLYQEKNKASLTLYPLKNSKGDTLAVITIQARIDNTELSNTILLVLQVYQNFAGLIRDNEHDTLTGLLNRKTFDNKMNKVMTLMHKEKARKDDKVNSCYNLAIFDIDHFKKVNDVYGHLIGDEVLLLFSQMMTDTFREKDMLFRYGGEEFVGVFECSDNTDILLALERFRTKIADHVFPQVGHVTVSIGYTQILQYDTNTQMVERADLALYYAKNNGRNRVCYYEELIATGQLIENKIEGEIELF